MGRLKKQYQLGIVVIIILTIIFISTIPPRKNSNKQLNEIRTRSEYSLYEEKADSPELVQKEDEPEESNEEKSETSTTNGSNPQATPNQSTTPPVTQNNSAPSGDVMSGIRIAEAENVSYTRTKYQPNWSVGSGCDIRSRILTQYSTIQVQYGSNGCTVKYGSWNDPYSGAVLTGNPYQGDGTANDLDIDHIIPLNYVNSHGGYYWPDAQKHNYGASLDAMSKGVYVAVSASENRKKGDKGPSQYYPPNAAYRCEYSKRWRDIARAYAIALSSADYNVVKSVLISCGIQ